MEPAGTNLGRFPSKFLLMIIPGLIASGLAAAVLYSVHVSRAPSSSDLLSDVTPQSDGLSAEERRGLTRQMLKARRENPQEPAQVRPTPTSRPADGTPVEDPVADAKAAPDRAPPDRSPSDRAPAERAPSERAPAAAPLPIARPALARARPDAAVTATPAAPLATSGAVAPPAAATAQSDPLPLAPTNPTLQPPMTVNPPSGTESEPRGFAANVFSSLSTFAGTAANATGNTVNWVIDLPGKAISAGGRLLGGDSSTSNQPAESPPSAGTAPSPASVPPPATAPPPKRNL
jgi:hypothetical protein